jgi:hypothetical protein
LTVPQTSTPLQNTPSSQGAAVLHRQQKMLAPEGAGPQQVTGRVNVTAAIGSRQVEFPPRAQTSNKGNVVPKKG